MYPSREKIKHLKHSANFELLPRRNITLQNLQSNHRLTFDKSLSKRKKKYFRINLILKTHIVYSSHCKQVKFKYRFSLDFISTSKGMNSSTITESRDLTEIQT